LLETLLGRDGESIGATGLMRSACARCSSSRSANLVEIFLDVALPSTRRGKD
jgi:hypothetical protein